MLKITVCIGSSCHIKGSRSVVEQLQYLIAENNLGDKVTVNQAGCFGFCSQGPFVKIYPEDTLYRLVQVEDVQEIFEKDILIQTQ